MIPPETRYALAPDGVHIAYQINGRPAGDAVDLVMMQGTVAHLEIAWEDSRLRRLFERLGSFSRLIRFDRRGMGMSDVLHELPTFEQQVGDFGTVMDAAGSERAALMGTIDAGTLALAFAAEHPQQTSAVVAFESAPRYTPSPDDDFGVDPEMLGRMAAASEAIDVATHLSIVAPSRSEEAGFPSWFRRYVRSASSGVLIQAFMAATMTWDIRDRLPSIDAPVLVLIETGTRSCRLGATVPSRRSSHGVGSWKCRGTGRRLLRRRR